MKNFLCSFLFVLLLGCAFSTGHIQSGKIAHISVGMTKQEVVSAIGPPESVSATKEGETLFYVEERPWWQWVRIAVKLVNGKVSEFGEVK